MCIINDALVGLSLSQKKILHCRNHIQSEGREGSKGQRARLHTTTLYSVNADVVIHLSSQLPCWWLMGRAQTLIFPINLIVVR